MKKGGNQSEQLSLFISPVFLYLDQSHVFDSKIKIFNFAVALSADRFLTIILNYISVPLLMMTISRERWLLWYSCMFSGTPPRTV